MGSLSGPVLWNVVGYMPHSRCFERIYSMKERNEWMDRQRGSKPR